MNTVEIDNKYILTDAGDLYRKTKHGIEQCTKRKHRNGYIRYTMNNKDHYAHRLVAEYFISNPNGYKEVNHIDGNKTNNDVSNLEWCSRSMNNKHAFQTGLRQYSELSKMAHMPKYSRRVLNDLQIQKVRELVSEGLSDGKIAEQIGCSRGTVWQLRNGRTYVR